MRGLEWPSLTPLPPTQVQVQVFKPILGVFTRFHMILCVFTGFRMILCVFTRYTLQDAFYMGFGPI